MLQAMRISLTSIRLLIQSLLNFSRSLLRLEGNRLDQPHVESLYMKCWLANFIGCSCPGGKIRKAKPVNVDKNKGENGFNAASGVYEDLVKAGVIDPTKVTRTALQNASSISALMLTTEAMICEIPEKKAAPAGGGGDNGPGMDY